ncbi:hypothetical protein AB0C10_37775 [Microbispora amethystogenes]|uniref:hypothetical protein n=1 Tax=Microbispora amethystogenes TaxID=1427754 RepID=UPI0033E3755D
MTAFAALTRSDIVERGDLHLLVCELRHTGQGCCATVQALDDHLFPVGLATNWPSSPDTQVTVLRHHGVWTPSELPGQSADVMAENGVTGGAR